MTARLAVAGTVVFVALGLLVAGHWAPLLSLDTRLDTAVHGVVLAHGWPRSVALVVTDLGSPVAVDMVAVVAAAALLVARRVPDAVAVVVARLVELGIETAVKALVNRSRPVFSHPVATAGGGSFPSGHTAGSAVLYGILVLLLVRRLVVTIAATVFVLAVGASRVVLGVHYLSDVVGGLALGLAVAAGTLLLRDWAKAASLVKKGT
ncbi:MAG TPA: phosphatase PAP2 family protein [Pseudonocardiaceae bacterium]|nr:phosphatase PAP2 family protein [Pseudonocardiaceae bacterium]